MFHARLIVDRLVRWYPCRDEHYAFEAELKICLLCADQVTKVWRIEGSAEDPDAHSVRDSRGSRTNVAGALDQVLEGAQLADANRAARVELLR